ncbi:toxin-antitoxin system HicB family antitoxin [Bremerella sp. T1]|uniref:toxin-antitoxin system HicB family antitoxin n=1 Tax=Bremerella sp. TYQ1 TaxID=3119568 RepID=UPI001CCE5E25|nr:toxin-antitoxin system HicB family antitoxin [Bremerella volcania]UBM38162.1 toxin-antitoxin system HicB family antitoxin [Bremerella volcania]
MAKKASDRSANQKSVKSDSSSPEGLTDLRIRLDSNVHQQIKQVAEENDISLNQLVCGILEGIADRLQPGYPVKLGSGEFVQVEPRAKCLFAGEPGRRYLSGPDEDNLEEVVELGEVWFILDYSGRPVRYSVERRKRN